MSRGTPWWKYTGRRWVAVAFLAAVCVGGLVEEGRSLLGTRTLTADDLASPTIGAYAEVTCDSLERVGSFERGWRAYLCVKGDRELPVVLRHDGDGPVPSTLTGRLRAFHDPRRFTQADDDRVDFVWPDEVVNDPAVARAYLEVTSPWEARFFAIVAILCGLAAGVLSVRWWWLPRRRARATR